MDVMSHKCMLKRCSQVYALCFSICRASSKEWYEVEWSA